MLVVAPVPVRHLSGLAAGASMVAMLGGSAGRVVVLLELLRPGRAAPYSQRSIAGASVLGGAAGRVVVLLELLRAELRAGRAGGGVAVTVGSRSRSCVAASSCAASSRGGGVGSGVEGSAAVDGGPCRPLVSVACGCTAAARARAARSLSSAARP